MDSYPGIRFDPLDPDNVRLLLRCRPASASA